MRGEQYGECVRYSAVRHQVATYLFHQYDPAIGAPPLKALGADARTGCGHARSGCPSWIEELTHRLVGQHYPALLDVPGPFPVKEFLETELYESYGVDYWIDDHLPRGMEGMTLWDEDAQFSAVMLPRRVHQQLRANHPKARFTAAHEIGHALLHSPHAVQSIRECHHDALRSSCLDLRSDDVEWEADLFAMRLLMPSKAVRIALGTHADPAAGRLAEQFGVPPSAVRMRLRHFDPQ